MKKVFIITLLLSLNFKTKAQDYRKYWKDGKLTWNDFQAKHTKNHSSHLAYVLLYQTDKKTINNINYHGVFSNAYIDKSLSFSHPNLKDEYHLKYNQVIFNLVEIEKRKLQKRIYSLSNVYEINSIFSDTKSQLDRKILDFQEEGNYGLQRDVTDKWLTKTEQELLTTKSFEIPDFRKSKWTYGMYGGVDYSMYGDTYKEIFNNTIALTLGFEFSYKKLYLGLNISLTNSKLNNNLTDNSFTILKGEKSIISTFNASLGYPIYETEKFRLMPFVGYGLTAFGETGKDKNKDETTSGTSFFGINLDFKNRKTINFTPSLFNVREEGYSYFRARFFIGKSNFNPNLKGYSFNIGLAYGIEGKLLSIK